MKQLFLFLMISVSTLAKTVDCYVFDINNNPIVNVVIRNVESGKVVFSDSKGFFKIEGNDSDLTVFSLAGYVTAELTIKNIKNSNGKIYLFNEMHIILPEVFVTPNPNLLYELHEKAVFNLKRRLINNKTISYKCTFFEKELNFGDERGLNILFTATLNNTNPKSKNINYQFLLSQLEITHGTQTSKIMKDEKLRHSSLFVSEINTKMPKSQNNSMQFFDSIIMVKNGTKDYDIVYTIDKNDTTLIKIVFEIKSDSKYRQFRTFKGKRIYSSFSAEFRKNAEGYYLCEIVWNSDFSFLFGKPEREERIVSSYKISVLPYTIQDASQKFDLDTRKLFKMNNYPVVSQ